MPINTAKVVVGHVSMFLAPAGTAAPADTANIGTDWATPWTNVGASEEGLSFIVGTDTNDIRIEEQETPVAVLVTARNVRVEIALAEDTLQSMKYAYGGGDITVTAPGATQPGKSVLTLNDTLDKLAVGFEGLNSFGFYRRVYIPTVLSLADVTTVYRRAENNRSYQLSLRAVCPTSQIAITDKTANVAP